MFLRQRRGRAGAAAHGANVSTIHTTVAYCLVVASGLYSDILADALLI